jgi:tripartite-type tricarboxylate transporter receptor subunit TctC
MATKMRAHGFILIVFGMVLLLGNGVGQTAEFPAKPITLIVPVGAGESHDLTARAVASVATDYLGRPIIVQVKPGGGGAIGSDFVSKAAPDGYTLLFGGPGWSTTLPDIVHLPVSIPSLLKSS